MLDLIITWDYASFLVFFTNRFPKVIVSSLVMKGPVIGITARTLTIWRYAANSCRLLVDVFIVHIMCDVTTVTFTNH